MKLAEPVLILVLTLAACGDSEASSAPSWQAPDAYAFTLDSSCGERSLIGRFRVVVEGGSVVEAEGLDERGRVAVESSVEIPNLSELLDQAARAEEQRADAVEVRATDDGRPMRIEIDWDTDATDDEACYLIVDYTELPRSAGPAAAGSAHEMFARMGATSAETVDGPMMGSVKEVVSESDAVVLAEVLGIGPTRTVIGDAEVDQFEVPSLELRVDEVLAGELADGGDDVILLETLVPPPFAGKGVVLVGLRWTANIGGNANAAVRDDPSLVDRYWPTTIQSVFTTDNGSVSTPMVVDTDPVSREVSGMTMDELKDLVRSYAQAQ